MNKDERILNVKVINQPSKTNIVFWAWMFTFLFNLGYIGINPDIFLLSRWDTFKIILANFIFAPVNLGLILSGKIPFYPLF